MTPSSMVVALRLLFLLATDHTLLRMFLNIWRQILFPGDLQDAALQNFQAHHQHVGRIFLSSLINKEVGIFFIVHCS